MKKAELIFIPSPGLSHLIPTVETAELLLRRHYRLTVTVLLIPKPLKDAKIESFIQNTSSSRLRFINLPEIEKPTSDQNTHFLFDFIDNQTSNVRGAVCNLMKQSDSQVAGLVLDIFCLEFVKVAGEFGLPPYLFFTASAYTLGLFQHILSLKFEENVDLMQFRNSDVELPVSCFSVPVPARVLPAVFVDEHFAPDVFLNHVKRLSEVRGIIVNTFYELEPYAVESLLSDRKMPDIYPVGPVLNLNGGVRSEFDDDVKKWLDDQPQNSVVFLCFGTMGNLDGAQVREIALALEICGFRFLWSLRKPEMMRRESEIEREKNVTSEYEDFDEVLPEGFLERTEGVGKVIGWAAQVAVLAHLAVGGFVSHCGWNSTLESIWFGVPMATFPMYAEQQLNAFYLVEEVRMAEAITVDYQMDFTGAKPPEIVGMEEIAAALRRLMAAEGGSGVRKKVEEMREKARAALVEGGSSYNAQSLFIEDVMRNIDLGI